MSKMRNRNLKASEQVKCYKSRYVSAKKRLKLTEVNSIKLANELGKKVQENEEIRRINDEFSDVCKSLNEQIESLENEINSLVGDNKALTRENVRLDAELNKVNYRIEKYKQQLEAVGKPLWKRVFKW